MVERRPALDFLAHAVLIIGVLIVAFPVYVTFVASTHTAQDIVQSPMPLLPGAHRSTTTATPGSAPATAWAPTGRHGPRDRA